LNTTSTAQAGKVMSVAARLKTSWEMKAFMPFKVKVQL
jgi:hypothetical protein